MNEIDIHTLKTLEYFFQFCLNICIFVLLLIKVTTFALKVGDLPRRFVPFLDPIFDITTRKVYTVLQADPYCMCKFENHRIIFKNPGEM